MADDLPPFAPEWLEAEKMMGGRVTLPVEPVEQSRERFQTIFGGVKPFIPPPTDAVGTTETEFAPGKKVRIYTPADASDKLPVGLYIHSGGWYVGDIDQEDFQCRTIAEKSQMILYSPFYRLAPEHPYPAGFDDVCAAYEYMHKTAGEYGGDANRKFIMGGSAGGNLSAAVALKYVSKSELKPAGLVVACMVSCDPKAMPAEYKSRYTPAQYTDSPMINNEVAQLARDWYNAPPDNPYASPLLHPDIKLLPPVYVAATTKDPTHQETVFFYEECKRQGVKAELIEWVGWPHFFWIVPMLQKSAEFLDVWCEKLRQMVSGV